jgi:hypothetical protein
LKVAKIKIKIKIEDGKKKENWYVGL